jgi:hypothetical protein
MVTQTKDEGNVRTFVYISLYGGLFIRVLQTLFKKGNHVNAIKNYNMAASIAVQRPPWEANQFMREELSTVISNRSAAYLKARDYIATLADAEIVISLRRNWTKGPFRKAKTLVAMDQLTEASETLKLGLAFEPGNTVRRPWSACCFYFTRCRNCWTFWRKSRLSWRRTSLKTNHLLLMRTRHDGVMF